MRKSTKSTATGRLAIGVLGVAALVAGTVAAQPADKPSPTARPQVQPDPELLVKPPDHGNPRLVKPAPADRDPGLVKKPPADAKPAGDKATRPPADEPGAPSRQDDCRGTAEDCKQNSPR